MPNRLRPTLRLALTATLLALAPAPALAGLAGWPGGDPDVRPQDDMFHAANGGWLARTEIPADKRAFGTFLQLRERSDAEVRALLEEAARKPGKDADAQLIGAFYGSFKDTAAIDRKGLVPLARELARIGRLKNLADVARHLGELGIIGAGTPIGAWVQADAKDPTVNTVYWTHGGLGLPDREDYLSTDEKAEQRRVAYKAYLTTLFKLAAQDAKACPVADELAAGDPAAEADAVFAFEKRLAAIHWKRAERRDPLKTYNPLPLAEVPRTYGDAFPWEAWAAALGVPKGSTVVVRETSFFKAFPALAAETPLETWQAYMRARLLGGAASMLPAAYRRADFEFHGRVLQGLTEPEKRWQVAVRETNGYVGEAIGKRFVALHFPPAAKARMQGLVANLLAAYREGLENLAWMTPETRKQALGKLAGLRVKIGYPDVWRGYRLAYDRTDALGNTLSAARFLHTRDMAEAGKPVDRSRWMMEPQVVNAYYSPLGNEIVFPAAILRPPFFDLLGDDAYNYGAIGAVIGHEISHGFDDSGRRYDAEGRLRDWWTPADEAAFNERASRLIAQYGAYEPLPGLKVDGQLTLGENIADLAGVAMAYRAYQHSLAGKPAPVKDGYTGAQRFFLGYARVWRSKSRPEWLRTRLQTDSHSPEQYRVNGVLTNLDAFHEAFGLKPGDGMFKAAADRVRIW